MAWSARYDYFRATRGVVPSALSEFTRGRCPLDSPVRGCRFRCLYLGGVPLPKLSAVSEAGGPGQAGARSLTSRFPWRPPSLGGRPSRPGGRSTWPEVWRVEALHGLRGCRQANAGSGRQRTLNKFGGSREKGTLGSPIAGQRPIHPRTYRRLHRTL